MTHDSPTLLPSDFIPTYLEYPSRRDENKRGSFALSLFDSEENYNNMLEFLSPKARKKFVGIAIGKTNELFGMSEQPDSKGHINYFLYDAYNKNPVSDFKKV